MLLSDFRTLIRRIYNQHVQNGKSNPHFHTTWIDSIAACMVPDHAVAKNSNARILRTLAKSVGQITTGPVNDWPPVRSGAKRRENPRRTS